MDTLPDELLERVLVLARARERGVPGPWRYADVSRRFYRLVAGARRGTPLYKEVSLGVYRTLTGRRYGGETDDDDLRALRRKLAALAEARLGAALLARLSLTIDVSCIDSRRLALTRWTSEERETLHSLGAGITVVFAWSRALRGPLRRHRERAWRHPLGWRAEDEGSATRYALGVARALVGDALHAGRAARRLVVSTRYALDARDCAGYEEYVFELGAGAPLLNAGALQSARLVECLGGDEAWAEPLYGGPQLRGFAGELERAMRDNNVAAARAFVQRYGAAPLERQHVGAAAYFFNDETPPVSLLTSLATVPRGALGIGIGLDVLRYLVDECGARVTPDGAVVRNDKLRAMLALPADVLRLLVERGGLAPSVDYVYASSFGDIGIGHVHANNPCQFTALHHVVAHMVSSDCSRLETVLAHTRSRRVLDARCGLAEETALHACLSSGVGDALSAAHIKCIVAQGASPSLASGNHGNTRRCTPLVAAVLRERPLCALALLEAGASPLECTPGGTSALYLACMCAEFDTAHLAAFFDALPAAAAPAPVRRHDKRTLLHAVAQSDWMHRTPGSAENNLAKALYLVIQRGVDPRARDAEGKRAHELCDPNSLLRVELLARAAALDAEDAAAAVVQ